MAAGNVSIVFIDAPRCSLRFGVVHGVPLLLNVLLKCVIDLFSGIVFVFDLLFLSWCLKNVCLNLCFYFWF